MTKIELTIGLGAALLLTSCEPLPVYPENNRPPRRGIYDDQNDRRPQPDRYDNPNDYDNRNDNRYGNGNGYDNRDQQLQPQVERQPARNEYPQAERTANSNQVLSPYAPYNVIDVEGFRSGQLAKDPSNGKIFRVP